MLRYDKSPPYPPQDFIIVRYEELMEFVKSVFLKLGVPEEDAKVTAENLVTADLRGIESHGVARL
ncbi:MAG: Ldh family oxidoreductase, partial [Candidatus Korarchaeum sp.]|nr:Ldh family oxidoreductase [Candidatus Korarchaeum sp.]